MPVPPPDGEEGTGWVGLAGGPAVGGAADGPLPVAVGSGPVVPVMVRVLDGPPAADGSPLAQPATAAMTSPAATSSQATVRCGVRAMTVGRCVGQAGSRWADINLPVFGSTIR